MMSSLCKMIGALSLATLALTAHADDIQVAVASNFAEPMQAIANAFNQASGHQVKLSSGSTGQFYAQIRNGAPFEVFISADDTTPLLLEREGFAVNGSHFTYATGKLVLWSASPGVVDDKGEVLQHASIDHLAIANPATAPYGTAAVETLKKLGLYDSLQPRLVTGDNITQTFQFVSTGNAALGFVALSQVFLDGKISRGSAWVVPDTLYEPLHQDAVLLNAGKDKAAARALLEFLHSTAARDIMHRYGYDT